MDHGFYFIKDDFYEMVDKSLFKDNKHQHRPHYFCIEDSDGLLWMIPLSSKVEKYQAIYDKKIAKHKKCDTIEIAEVIGGTKSVFLIQNMFPIVPFFLAERYTVNNVNVEIKDEKLLRSISTKARTIRALMLKGIQFTPYQPDIIGLRKFLLKFFPTEISPE